jgi:hypothetical protein
MVAWVDKARRVLISAEIAEELPKETVVYQKPETDVEYIDNVGRLLKVLYQGVAWR